MTDVRFASRQLLKSPGFTLLALMTLALGIGLNSAIFSLIDDLFLRGLPYSAPERVVHMYANAKDRGLNEIALSGPRFMQYREAQTVFTDFAAETFSDQALQLLGIEMKDGRNKTQNKNILPLVFGGPSKRLNGQARYGNAHINISFIIQIRLDLIGIIQKYATFLKKTDMIQVAMLIKGDQKIRLITGRQHFP